MNTHTYSIYTTKAIDNQIIKSNITRNFITINVPITLAFQLIINFFVHHDIIGSQIKPIDEWIKQKL